MAKYKVEKRDGTVVKFDRNKISDAITKAFIALNKSYSAHDIKVLTSMSIAKAELMVQNQTEAQNIDQITVETIQDAVEWVLSQAGYADVAKAYILYRKQHENARNAHATLVDYKKIIDDYLSVNDWRVKENSTVNYSIGGLILSNSGAITANYWLSEIYDKEIADAHRSADIHIHDLSFLGGYCAGWSLRQLIKEGLGGVPGKITSSPASHLSTLCNQMVNFLGILQNEWSG